MTPAQLARLLAGRHNRPPIPVALLERMCCSDQRRGGFRREGEPASFSIFHEFEHMHLLDCPGADAPNGVLDKRLGFI